MLLHAIIRVLNVVFRYAVTMAFFIVLLAKFLIRRK